MPGETCRFLRVEPDFWQNTAEAEFLRNSMQEFENAFSTVQPPRTIIVPLTGSEEDRLARMNQKTRYNIRLAQKKDLVIREENNVSAFMELMAKTGERDHFHVHSAEYYQHCYNVFKESGKAWNLVAIITTNHWVSLCFSSTETAAITSTALHLTKNGIECPITFFSGQP